MMGILCNVCICRYNINNILKWLKEEIKIYSENVSFFYTIEAYNIIIQTAYCRRDMAIFAKPMPSSFFFFKLYVCGCYSLMLKTER